MPVVGITTSRLKKFLPRISEDRIFEMLPFAGLDIEGVEGGVVRVEYNPNRPDFSSDYGIFRALRGIMGIELGLPKFRLASSGVSITVDRRVKGVRPFVFALVARDGAVDEATIKQLIAMQEDLHEGIGRRRRKASIGIHNFDSIKFPLRYTTAEGDYSFVALGESSPMSIKQVLLKTETGKQYAHLLSGSDRFPVIIDKSGEVLSFPPITNGRATTVDESTRNLFVEVTATSSKVGQDVLAIIAMTLQDSGFRIGSVSIRDGRTRFITPDMKPYRLIGDIRKINSTLGLKLDGKQLVKSLRKSRLDARVKGNQIECTIPRYRTDISHSVDLAEEVAIGYGVYNFAPEFPPSLSAGSTSALSRTFAAIREALIGLGMIESLSFSLSSRQALYGSFGRSAQDAITVDGPKSAEHEFLRDSLVPSLLQALSRNVHEEYPQKIFEIGKVFRRENRPLESWSLAACVAHSDAGYTEIKSAMQSLMSSVFGKDVETKPAASPFFIGGRSASVVESDTVIGIVGEVVPAALESLKMRVPVSAFEIDLTRALDLPHKGQIPGAPN